MNGSKRPPPGAAFAFEMGLRSLDEQLRRIEALDSKAGVLIAADGVLAGLLFARGSLLLAAPRFVTTLAAMALIASLAMALVAFANRKYDSAPRPEAIVPFVLASEETLRWRSVSNVLEVLKVNRRKLALKISFLSWALASLLVAVGFVGGYFVYALITKRLS